MTVWRIINIIR